MTVKEAKLYEIYNEVFKKFLDTLNGEQVMMFNDLLDKKHNLDEELHK